MLKLQDDWFLGLGRTSWFMFFVLVCPEFVQKRLPVPLLQMSSPISMMSMGFRCGTLAQCPGVNRIHRHQGWSQVNLSLTFHLSEEFCRRVPRKDNKQRETSIFSVIYHFGDIHLSGWCRWLWQSCHFSIGARPFCKTDNIIETDLDCLGPERKNKSSLGLKSPSQMTCPETTETSYIFYIILLSSYIFFLELMGSPARLECESCDAVPVLSRVSCFAGLRYSPSKSGRLLQAAFMDFCQGLWGCASEKVFDGKFDDIWSR